MKLTNLNKKIQMRYGIIWDQFEYEDIRRTERESYIGKYGTFIRFCEPFSSLGVED